MTEIEQLRADLATIQKAAEINKKQGFHERSGNYDQVEGDLKQKIADLEAQQAQADEWAEAKLVLAEWDEWNRHHTKCVETTLVIPYVRHLEDQLNVATIRNLRTVEQLREKLAELTTIANAIPPACELSRELMEKRIEGVKREMQGNG